MLREQRLVDGLVPGPGVAVDDFGAALSIHDSAWVLFDLGAVLEIGTLELVTTETASAPIEVSEDGSTWWSVPLSPGTDGARLSTRRALDLRGRFIRLRASRFGSAFAELRVLADGAPSPPPLREQGSFEVVTGRLLRRTVTYARIQLVLLALALPATVLLYRSTGRRRVLTGSFLLALAAAGWVDFGWLHGGGRYLHPWDLSHYYLGAKYAPELGYTQIYRCIAAWERERGRGWMVDRSPIRDLETDSIRPGTWTATREGACRATFSAERWRAFGSDIDRLRRLFEFRHFHRVLTDHGYNATPFHTVWLRPLVERVPAERHPLAALASLDVLAHLVAVGALGWGFGMPTAALSGLLVGLGEPWSFAWTGGSIARAVWLAALSIGLAAVRRKRPLIAGSALTIAALLRLFPTVFLGAIVGSILFRRRSEESGLRERRLLLGVAATAALGLVAVLATSGPDVFPDFARNSVRHATTSPGNHLGLGALVSFGERSEATHLSSDAPEDRLSRPRRFAWAIGALGAVALFIVAVRRGAPPWMAIPLAGPLLYSAIPLASYDYVWCVVLAPLAAARVRRAVGWVSTLVLLQLIFLTTADPATAYARFNVVIGIAMLALCLNVASVLRRPEKLPCGNGPRRSDDFSRGQGPRSRDVHTDLSPPDAIRHPAAPPAS